MPLIARGYLVNIHMLAYMGECIGHLKRTLFGRSQVSALHQRYQFGRILPAKVQFSCWKFVRVKITFVRHDKREAPSLVLSLRKSFEMCEGVQELEGVSVWADGRCLATVYQLYVD